MKDILDILKFWEGSRGQPPGLALATLVAAHGSSFRRPGARMLINLAGESAGGVSAGCIEEEVILCAQQVLETGVPRLLTFDTRRRFGCSGTIDIYVEPASDKLLADLRDCLRQRQNCTLETVFKGEPQAQGTRLAGAEPVFGAFVQHLAPPLRLVLMGDGTECAALGAYGRILGWEVLQITGSPPLPVAVTEPDDRTAVLIGTHNYGRDCTILRTLLPLGLKYVGMVGSRRRRDELLFDVIHEDVACHSALYAPAGLHVGSESPEEIALSIAAEIQCIFGEGTARHLCHRKTAIHEPGEGSNVCIGSAA